MGTVAERAAAQAVGGATGEAAAAARYRADLYRAAAAAFLAEPTADELVRLAERANCADADACAFASEAALLAALADCAGVDATAHAERVATEYAALFVGPRPPLAPLYESVYRGEVRRLFTEVTMAVRRTYEEQGMQAPQRNRVPDDHLGYELEFMASLADREAACWEAGDRAAAREARTCAQAFLGEHLTRWVEPFCRRVLEAPCADYYAKWAQFVRDFIQEDERFLRGDGQCRAEADDDKEGQSDDI